MQIVVVAHWAAEADPYLLTASQAACIAALLIPWVPDLPRQITSLDASRVFGIGYLVIAGSVVAPLLQVLAQRTLSPGRIGLLFALAFALTWGQERYVARWWAGAARILAAVIIVESRAAEAQATSSRPATG